METITVDSTVDVESYYPNNEFQTSDNFHVTTPAFAVMKNGKSILVVNEKGVFEMGDQKVNIISLDRRVSLALGFAMCGFAFSVAVLIISLI